MPSTKIRVLAQITNETRYFITIKCYLEQEHETLDVNKSVLENMQYSATQPADAAQDKS